MIGIRNSLNVARCGLVYLLFGVPCWGYAVSLAFEGQESTPATAAIPKATGSDQSRPEGTSKVSPDAAVITISGLCDNLPADKSEGSNCKTVITRAEFEKLVAAVQPNMGGRARREFASSYAEALVMAKKAELMGLDKGENFEEQMKVARVQILSRDLKKVIQKETSQISDTDIDNYYHENASLFEEAEMERIYVPRAQDQTALPKKTLSDADKQEQLQQTEKSMKEVADKLHARAIMGEDFDNLQADAYKIAGIKTTASASLGKIRRVSLPRSQVWVMDLKPGEVSSVIEAPNGYFIYKIKTKETLSLEQAREEIKGVLRSRRLEEETRAIEESVTSTLNETYFHPPKTPQEANRRAGQPETQ